MKAITLVAFALIAAFAAAQGTIYMTQYADFMCKGAPTKNFTAPSGTCEAGSGGHQDITGVILTCPSSNQSALCASFDLYFGSADCSSQRDLAENIPCGQCLWEPMGGYYKYACDQITKSVTASRGCDKTCTTCNSTNTLTVGQCKQLNTSRFEQSAKLNSIQQCPPFINEKAWFNGTLCTGGHEHDFNLEVGVCYQGFTFSCTKPSQRLGRTMPREDPRREKVLGKMALQRFLHRQMKH